MSRLTWVTVGVSAAGVAVRLVGTIIGDHWLTTALLGAFPWFVALGVVGLGTAAVGRVRGHADWGAVVVAVAVVAAGGLVLGPRTVARAQPAAAGEQVTVAIVNVRIGAAQPSRIAQLVENTGADLLAVVEVTREFDARLRTAGIADALPTAAVEDVARPSGAVFAVGDLRPQRDGPPAGGTPDVVWTTPAGSEVTVTTLHAAAPVGPEATGRWRQGLAVTPAAGDGPSLVLGDFNATVDHATFREVLDSGGWRDAAGEAGVGLTVTYDGLLDWSPALPMAIDHVLVSPDIAVDDVVAYDVPGTDHRMLVVDLTLP